MSEQVAGCFIGKPRDIVRARHLVVAHLEAWGLGHERASLELVVSELVTNAVRHGHGPVEVHLTSTDEIVRVEVHDRGEGWPRMRAADLESSHPSGLGLNLVNEVVDGWGAEQVEGHTVVWAERAVRRAVPSGRADRASQPGEYPTETSLWG